MSNVIFCDGPKLARCDETTGSPNAFFKRSYVEIEGGAETPSKSTVLKIKWALEIEKSLFLLDHPIVLFLECIINILMCNNMQQENIIFSWTRF